MDILSIWLALLLAICVCFAAWQVAGLWRANRFIRDLKLELEATRADSKAKSNEPTYDCRLLLHDLTGGSAAVRITRLDPNELYVRRT